MGVAGLVGSESAAYSVSKGAIRQLTKAVAMEIACKSTGVNAIAPRIIETQMTVETRTSNQRPSS